MNNNTNSGELYTVMFKTNGNYEMIPDRYTDVKKAEEKLKKLRIMANMVGCSFNGRVVSVKGGK